MRLSVIVPVYNERRTIETLLDKVRRVPIEKEIIIIDGNSIDGTREILKAQERYPGTRVIYEPEPRGRGRAIKEGLRVATGEIVIFQDADLELDPADYPNLIEPIETGKAQVVFGSRFLAGKPRMGFLQYWGNKIINTMVNLCYKTRLTDVETCYQVFPLSVIRDIRVDNNDFAYTVELTVQLIKHGYNILEIPIQYIPRGRLEGKKVYWKDGIISLYTIIKYRIFS